MSHLSFSVSMKNNRSFKDKLLIITSLESSYSLHVLFNATSIACPDINSQSSAALFNEIFQKYQHA